MCVASSTYTQHATRQVYVSSLIYYDSISTLFSHRRVKSSRPGRGVNRPPLSSGEVKEIVELYVFSRSGPL